MLDLPHIRVVGFRFVLNFNPDLGETADPLVLSRHGCIRIDKKSTGWRDN